MSNNSDMDVILAEHDSRYDEFSSHAQITQEIKAIIYTGQSAEKLSPSQCEALNMIAHNLGRIVNGDPNYADSWIDIAGYAKLVADELEEKEKVPF